LSAVLDLWGDVGSTPTMIFYDTHELCQRSDDLVAIKHTKSMARQRYVGANGNCTG